MSKKLTREVERTQQKKSDRFYIGGSDMGALLGLHPTRSPLDLYNEKLGLVPPQEHDPLMDKGIELEPIAAKRFERETGEKLRKVPTLIHPEFPFIRGNIDREIASTGFPWEAKCPTNRRFNRWKHEGLPQWMIAQLVLYAGLKGSAGGVWSIFNADLWQSFNFPCPAEQRSYEIMIEVTVQFWTQHIEKRVPPQPGIIANPLVEFDVGPGELIRIETPEFLEAMQLLRDAKRHVAQAASLESMAKERIKSAVGDRKGKYLSSEGKLYWTMQKGRRTFEYKRLAMALPLDRSKVMQTLSDTLGPAKLKEVLAALKTCDLDLDEFFKAGESFEQMRAYFSHDTEEED